MDKTTNIIVTGGSSGIGKAIALDFASECNNIFITARNSEKLQLTQKEISNLGANGYYLEGDVSNASDVEKVCNEAMTKLSSIDLLVLSAGVGAFGSITDLTGKDYDDVFNTNVKGVFLWLSKIIPIMKKQGYGQIIVISSNLGIETTATGSLYCGSKFAIQGMIGSIRKELKGTKIKIATLNPGSVNTPWFDGKNADRLSMIQVNDLVQATRLIYHQGETSDIAMIHITPK